MSKWSFYENSNPSQPYRIAIRTLSLSDCSHENSVSLSVLKHVEASGICNRCYCDIAFYVGHFTLSTPGMSKI